MLLLFYCLTYLNNRPQFSVVTFKTAKWTQAVFAWLYVWMLALYSYGNSSLNVISGIALDYELDNRGSRVQFPAGTGNFSLHHRVQNGSWAHPASYPMGTRGTFPGGKVAEAWSWPLIPSSAEVKEGVELHIHSPNTSSCGGA